MPVYTSRTVSEITRRIRAFLSLDVGLSRGEVPEPEHKLEQVRQQLVSKNRKIAELQAKLAGEGTTVEAIGVKPENIIWIFGTPRSGSTWLGRMMSGLDGHALWDEPRVGELFGLFLTERGNHLRQDNEAFILTKNRYQNVWLKPRAVSDPRRSRARFPEAKHLTIKEPGGSTGAPFLMEVMPESRMILLVRDPRDVAASMLAGAKKGGWIMEAKDLGDYWKQGDDDPDAYVERRARAYLTDVVNAKRAYEAHEGHKALVRYEDLRADTSTVMQRIYSSLGVAVDGGELARVVKKLSWENTPTEWKGEGKIYRKATPGDWREDLTREQVAIVERITAPILSEFYPQTSR